MAAARVVITDSGGIQEETTVLGVPCLTVRTTTERPVTITEGTNRLVPPGDRRALLEALAEAVATPAVARRPQLWDGHAGERIAAAIETLARTPAGERRCPHRRVGLSALHRERRLPHPRSHPHRRRSVAAFFTRARRVSRDPGNR